MEPIKEALTFDDVLLLPQYSSVVPANTNLNINLSSSINLKLPFLSSAMDTVTESKMAIAMAKNGGIGIIHRNLDIKKQCDEIKKVKNIHLKVGAAIGTSEKELTRAKNLIDSGSDMIVIDTAHGHSNNVLKMLSKIKKKQVRSSHRRIYNPLFNPITISFCRKCSPFLFTGHSTRNPIANQMKCKKMQYINKLGFSGYIA